MVKSNIIKYDPDKSCKVKLDNNSKVEYISTFISKKDADKLYNHLLKIVPWVQGEYVMFGKPVKTPRLLWCMHDEENSVHKNYKVTGSSEWSRHVKKIKEFIENKFNTKLLYAQLNYYRDGSDYIGYHADKEVEDGDKIYSLSIGTERKFQIKPINSDSSSIHEFNLKHGSLIIMDQNSCRNKYKHQILKDNKITEGRINITFRNK
jgi:alkylated DNA repair dioxygenase AlkB